MIHRALLPFVVVWGLALSVAAEDINNPAVDPPAADEAAGGADAKEAAAKKADEAAAEKKEAAAKKELRRAKKEPLRAPAVVAPDQLTANEAAKKYSEATRQLNAAQQELQAAQAEAGKAETAEAKEQAQRKVEAAQQKVAELTKEVQARQAEYQKEAQKAQMAAMLQQYRGMANIRDDVSPDDKQERVLLLSPLGPLVVEIELTINGQPFRQGREKLIDELLALADADKDGKATWPEALKNMRFTFGRIRVADDGQAEQYAAAYDLNQNGLVDRNECRRFLAQFFGGSDFNVSPYRNYFAAQRVVVVNGNAMVYPGGSPEVKDVLDGDKDGVLSEAELVLAEERLRTRDADDNDLVEAHELVDAVKPGDRAAAIRLQAANAQRQGQMLTAVLLGPTADAAQLHAALLQVYGVQEGEAPQRISAESFKADAALFKQLDANENGTLDPDECPALTRLAPHVRLAVNCAPEGQQEVKLLAVADSLGGSSSAGAAGPTVSVPDIPGMKLVFNAAPSQVRNVNFDQTAKIYLDRYDMDKNGYIDKKEGEGPLNQQFGMWDANGDEKVFKEEIIEMFERQYRPQETQIQMTAGVEDNSLFQALDTFADGRLSLRELKNAAAVLKKFDKNADGKVERPEVPITLKVAFGQGNAAYQVQAIAFNAARNGGSAQPGVRKDSPEWFQRMDRNGDGDVTLREFLGDEEQFKKLDTNGDGFIEIAEAKAAEEARANAETKPAE